MPMTNSSRSFLRKVATNTKPTNLIIIVIIIIVVFIVILITIIIILSSESLLLYCHRHYPFSYSLNNNGIAATCLRPAIT